MSVIRKIVRVKTINKKLAAAFTSRRPYSNQSSQFILHSDLEDVEIPKVSLDQYLFEKTHNWPQRIATECAATGRKYTYEEIQTKSINLNRNLRKKLKLQKGDVVALLLPNSPEFIMATIGALKAGLVVTTLNPIYTPDEIARQLKDSSTKAIITFVDFYELAKASANLTQSQINILTIKTQQGQAIPQGALNFDEFTEPCDYPDVPPPDTNDIAFLPYSSGTTGLPKGVQLSHRNILANLCQFNARELSVIQDTTQEHQDVIPAVLPKFHIYGLTATTLHLFYKGCKTVAISKFSPEGYLQTLRKYKPDVIFVAPPLVLFLASHPSVTSNDLQSIRSVVSGAAPLGALDEERFITKAQKDINILQGYGLTETSPMVAMTRAALKKLPNSSGTIGRPVSNTSVKIIDPNDPNETPLGANTTGELVVKGPQVMKGYHNRPEETRDAFTKDGWFRTGDMMYYDDNKLLFVSDRLKELIKVKGFQVPPAELEEIIRDFPEVKDAAVIGVPHPKDGEVPRAYIVGKNVDVNKLEEFVAQKVAPYKRLRGGIEIVESIPKNATGKILRRALKEEFEKKMK
ncbi:4-coumarate--CoA ligase 1-like Protein [Tribolium castaneum]|uniref:Luciferin 4-monooxygenase n=1 Tax=Tribolium castaneum TaxID=7070 RepID=D2A1H7_TRICA|nr:PREDICTED: 4-coumarate--CoA ligase 1 [Tribolium castaneum]EFA01538.1 4-coumarate--CoA ligase 1-like Protein [Tribolium castaneum]|eukprot:XP_015834355.1 PREDICTED: 4-coumarate--CoA ligase 1 [Tribolium castaneum]